MWNFACKIAIEFTEMKSEVIIFPLMPENLQIYTLQARKISVTRYIASEPIWLLSEP